MSRLPPWSLIEITVEPKLPADRQKLVETLRELSSEDRTFRFSTDPRSGRILLGGVDQRHLAGKIDILKRNYEIAANIGPPQVAYRETIGYETEIDFTHKRQTGSSGQFARVKIVFEPVERGGGNRFESRIWDRQLPRAYVLAVEKGLYHAAERGLVAGYPVIDIKSTLVGGAYHDLDSSAQAFEIAARGVLMELSRKGDPELLEPIMSVEVSVPEDWVGDVIGDLNARLGQIQGADQLDDSHVLVATVPLARMLGYDSFLRAMTGGRGAFHMEYDHYAPASPPSPDDTFPQAMAMRVAQPRSA